MAQHRYSSYISHLDSLVFDSIVDTNQPSDMETEANLALWTNAQFTFDVQPESGILDDIKPSPILTSSSSSSPETVVITTMNSPTSTITYENLANYLDYELPQQQMQHQPLTTTIQPRVAAAAAHQLLLPKIVPAMTFEEITKALLSTATTQNIATPTISSTSTVIPMEISTNNEKAPVEEDKRRRNTAASARFRIKKKMREQTMESTVREMTEKSTGLENKVKELELEIKWLRSLLIEKGTAVPSSAAKNTTTLVKSKEL